VIFSKNIAIKLGFKKNVVDYLVENYEKVSLDELKKKVFADFVITWQAEKRWKGHTILRMPKFGPKYALINQEFLP